MAALLKILSLFLLSTVKFTVAAFLLAFQYRFDVAYLILLFGGVAGVLFFWVLWEKILLLWRKYFVKNKDKALVKIKQRRRIVKAKRQYGYWGIIVLTPILLSIPLGVFIIKRYFSMQKGALLALFFSVAIWGLILLVVANLFNL